MLSFSVSYQISKLRWRVSQRVVPPRILVSFYTEKQRCNFLVRRKLSRQRSGGITPQFLTSAQDRSAISSRSCHFISEELCLVQKLLESEDNDCADKETDVTEGDKRHVWCRPSWHSLVTIVFCGPSACRLYFIAIRVCSMNTPLPLHTHTYIYIYMKS
jgi:hypothetical protein